MYEMSKKWIRIKRTDDEILYFKRDEVEGITIKISDQKDLAHLTLIMAGGHQHQIDIVVPNNVKNRYSISQQEHYIESNIDHILKEIDKEIEQEMN